MNQEEIDVLIDDVRDAVLCAWDTFGWIQGDLGDDQLGYCMVGAWNRATGRDTLLFPVWEACAEEVIHDLFPGRPQSIISFNDFEHASEEDVRLLAKHSFERMKEKLPELLAPDDATVSAPATDITAS